jgi:hypothetical protein
VIPDERRSVIPVDLADCHRVAGRVGVGKFASGPLELSQARLPDRLDVMHEICPALESVLARDDELDVREGDVRGAPLDGVRQNHMNTPDGGVITGAESLQ